MSAWIEKPGPGHEPLKRASPAHTPPGYAPRTTRPGLRAPDCASRYEHVGFGDQFEPEPLLPRALKEFHMTRRKTQPN
jgi:hypothetical protein